MVYSVQYNGLVLRPEDGFTVSLQEGMAGAPVRLSSDVLTGQHGGVVYASRNGPRPVTLAGTIHANTPEEFFARRRQILAAFSTAQLLNELTITMWDGQVYTTQAAVTQTPQITDITGRRTQNRFQVQLLCPDSFIRTGIEQVFTINPEAAMRGFPLPAPLPMPLGYKGAGSITVIENIGDVPVVPMFRIDGYIENAVITNLTTGLSFSITTIIPANRFVDIYKEGGDDFVLLDGVTPFYQNFIGDIFPILPGNNTLRVTATTFDSNALVTITYQDERNGV